MRWDAFPNDTADDDPGRSAFVTFAMFDKKKKLLFVTASSKDLYFVYKKMFLIEYFLREF